MNIGILHVAGWLKIESRSGEFLAYCTPQAAEKLMLEPASVERKGRKRSHTLIWIGPDAPPPASLDLDPLVHHDFPGARFGILFEEAHAWSLAAREFEPFWFDTGGRLRDGPSPGAVIQHMIGAPNMSVVPGRSAAQ